MSKQRQPKTERLQPSANLSAGLPPSAAVPFFLLSGLCAFFFLFLFQMDNVKENKLPSVLKDTDHWEKASVSQRTQSLPGPLQWWPGAVRPLAGKGVSGSDSRDNSIVHFVGKLRVFFLYSYIIDTFYLLVVNYCCYLVCLKLPGCWASVYMCTPSPTCPPHLGGWWPAAAKKPKKSFPFFFFFSFFLRYCAPFLERGR